MSDGHTRYRADIDGLRALAVIPVVLFHGHVPALRGGFVGVDVFFIISGFLICSVIGQELSRGSFSILRFYERRCRRILPALFAMFIATSLLALVVLMPPDLASFGRSLLSSVLFGSNIFFWKTSGYFDGMAELKPLLHTWSLSVEEQFYLIVPYVLMGTAVWFRKRYVAVLLPLALGSFVLSVWAVSHAPSAAFYMLPTRFWELMLGGLVGLGAKTGPTARWLREALAAAGLAAIVVAIVSYSDMTPFPGAAALLPCAGAALIIYAGLGGSSAVGRLLSQRPCVFIGKISYSLYLWHWPLFSLYRYQVGRELHALESALIIALSVLLSVLSWRFVEQPFRHPERVIGRRAIFRGAAFGALATATFAGTAMATGGLPARVPGFRIVAVPGESEYDAGGQGDCFLGDPQTAADWGGDRCFVTRGQGPTVLLWGDSFAAHYVPGLKRRAAQVRADILQYNLSACPPVLGFDSMSNPPCRAFNDHVFDLIERYHVSGVVVSGRWDYALRRHVTPEQIGATVARLRDRGVAVYVIGQSPLFGNQVQTLFAQAGGTSDQPAAWAPVTFAPDLESRLAAAMPAGVTFIDPLASMCKLRACQYRRDGEFMLWDEGHLSAYGSSLAVDTYFPYLD